jgi:hypothetical protein
LNTNKWEYRIESIPGLALNVVALLNELGEQSWELVSTTQNGHERNWIFKRPKSGGFDEAAWPVPVDAKVQPDKKK